MKARNFNGEKRELGVRSAVLTKKEEEEWFGDPGSLQGEALGVKEMMNV